MSDFPEDDDSVDLDNAESDDEPAAAAPKKTVKKSTQPRETRKKGKAKKGKKGKGKADDKPKQVLIEEWEDVHDSVCGECEEGGELICCDTCTRAYHIECIQLKEIPEGFWQCYLCKEDNECVLPAVAQELKTLAATPAVAQAAVPEVQEEAEPKPPPQPPEILDAASVELLSREDLPCPYGVQTKYLRGLPRVHHVVQKGGGGGCYVKVMCLLRVKKTARANRNFTCGHPCNQLRARRRALDFLNSPEMVLWLEERLKMEVEKCTTGSEASTASPFDDRPRNLLARDPHASLKFKIGWKVEAVDRRCPSNIAVATITKIDTSRVLLHFDGHPPEYTYWCSITSGDFAPPGTARSLGLALTRPPNSSSQFMWKHYLKVHHADAAPDTVFRPIGALFPNYLPPGIDSRQSAQGDGLGHLSLAAAPAVQDRFKTLGKEVHPRALGIQSQAPAHPARSLVPRKSVC
eukprot:TRINITY_DN18569_c0_g1::TRINITY_DN18569_c0_g1_i1::g.1086::m.1086 TRINITY_DN18569_c0_g1::TRINITY_DN18569_c0_g1_i1::g.1086  ORF type:complete len:463 (-),score=95.73,sp/Q8NA19/LMBL4_HUMAN/36.81/4e-14,sp/Q8NA19/LMBL4_HUMAN/31.58/2e-08,sp/Q8NA19/LMBL4_HUMAN/39.51/1e-06,MBT/PF02820.13/1.2e-13,PHD/PF00628.24/4.3e-08,PHD/PF00628.24/1.1e+04,PHD_2/PF13831.1/0.00097,DUF3789/PF12664.2/0.29,Mito_fiss_reg/PF05308.6/3.1e+02,Mito_fiss_reg/PF05308.6/0.76 TRINITY_DN18569_c0_g1_i1:9-1397(-)